MVEEQQLPAVVVGAIDETPIAKLRRWATADDISDELTDSQITQLGLDVKREYDLDVGSNSQYFDELRSVKDWASTRDHPDKQGMANFDLPFEIQAALDFSSAAYPEIIVNNEVVKPNPVVGTINDVTARQAAYLNWQNLYQNKQWRAQTKKITYQNALFGSQFRERYTDERYKQKTCVLTPMQFVVHSDIEDLECCPRMTKVSNLYPIDIDKKIRTGYFKEYKYHQEEMDDSQQPIEFLQQHRYIDLDDDGIPEPYIVFYDNKTERVVRVEADYAPDSIIQNQAGQVEDIERIQRYSHYPFIEDPKGGFYTIGFAQLIGRTGQGFNTILNQIVDAGTAANTTTGFIDSDVALEAGQSQSKNGRLMFVRNRKRNAKSLADSVFIMPAKEPSPTLFQTLGYLETLMGKFTATGKTDIANIPNNVGEMAALQMIQQGLKVFSGLFEQLYIALQDELTIQQRLNQLYPDPDTYMRVMQINPEQVSNGEVDVMAELTVINESVIPTADPRAEMERKTQAQFLLMMKDDPGIDGAKARQVMLEAAGFNEAAGLIPPGPTDEELQKQQQLADMQQQAMMMQQQLQLQLMQLEVSKKQAEIAKIQAETGTKEADMLLTGEKADTEKAEREKAIAETEQTYAETREIQRDTGTEPTEG